MRLGGLRTPDRMAVRMFGGQGRTYAELDERTNRLAQAFLGQGLRPGSRVAIWLPNCLEYIETYLACAKAGLVVVQINIRFTASEARYLLEDSSPEALVYGDEVAPAIDELEIVGDINVLASTGQQRAASTYDFEGFLRSGADVTSTQPDDDALLVIGYTSGTTGFPKGAMLTHRSIKTLGQTNALTSRYVLGSTQVFGLSLSFTAAIPAHVLPHLYVGGTTILLDHWDTQTLTDAIHAHRATFTIVPSPALSEFCELAENDPRALDSVVSVLHSASKAPPDQLQRLVTAIGPRLVEGWGMTENSGGLLTATVASDYLDPEPEIFDSAGRAAPDTAIMLVDNAGDPLPHDGSAVGQLIAHSASLATGY